MNRKTLLAFVVVILSIVTPASRAIQTTPKPATTSAAVSIPFELVVRHIMLPVRINDARPLSFILDTGDKFAIVDTDRARELALKLQGQVPVGGAGADVLIGSFVQGSTWTTPGLEGFSQPVTLAIPMGKLAARFGHDVDGIIGGDFIRQFVVEIDYQARVIKLHDKEKFSYSGSGESIPIQLNQQGHPTIEAEVTPIGGDPIKGRFVLDLGSGAALALYSPFVAEHHLLNPGLKTIKAIGSGGAGGKITGKIGRTSELKVGKFKIGSPITLFSEDKAGAMASSLLAGNIGQQIARKFRVFLDYDHGRIILEPAATFAEPFDKAQSGLALTTDGKDYKTFRITEVLESSPASEAGLRQDDLIIKIDDKPAPELTITRINEIFERPAAYKLTIRRGEQTLQVTLTPRKLV